MEQRGRIASHWYHLFISYCIHSGSSSTLLYWDISILEEEEIGLGSGGETCSRGHSREMRMIQGLWTIKYMNTTGGEDTKGARKKHYFIAVFQMILESISTHLLYLIKATCWKLSITEYWLWKGSYQLWPNLLPQERCKIFHTFENEKLPVSWDRGNGSHLMCLDRGPCLQPTGKTRLCSSRHPLS